MRHLSSRNPLNQPQPPERSITSNGELRRAAPRRTGEARTVNRGAARRGEPFKRSLVLHSPRASSVMMGGILGCKALKHHTVRPALGERTMEGLGTSLARHDLRWVVKKKKTKSRQTAIVRWEGEQLTENCESPTGLPRPAAAFSEVLPGCFQRWLGELRSAVRRSSSIMMMID